MDISVLHPSFVNKHPACKCSVKLDCEISEAVFAFYDFSIERDCYHSLSCYFVVETSPQALRLACVYFRSFSLGTSPVHFRLLLDSGDCSVKISVCFVN